MSIAGRLPEGEKPICIDRADDVNDGDVDGVEFRLDEKDMVAADCCKIARKCLPSENKVVFSVWRDGQYMSRRLSTWQATKTGTQMTRRDGNEATRPMTVDICCFAT